MDKETKPSWRGPLTRYPPEERERRHKAYIKRRDAFTFNKFIIDETDIPFLGKREDLPFTDIGCYTYKHSTMSWRDFYTQGDSDRGITVKVLQNGRYGVIYRCLYDYGWNRTPLHLLGDNRVEFE